MKPYIYTSLLLLLITLSGCGKRQAERHFTVTGKPYEVLVVADDGIWRSQAGDSLRSVLGSAVPMLNSYEPSFDVVRITPDALKGISTRHRNIVILKTGNDFHEPCSRIYTDRWARPQSIMEFTAPDNTSLAEYIGINNRAFIAVFEYAERLRTARLLKPNAILSETVSEMFGLNMKFADSFTERNRIGDNFIWISEERPLTSRGIVIYTEPTSHTSVEDFTEAELTALRNRSVRNIPGTLPDSHMTTSGYVDPLIVLSDIHSRKTVRMSGLWDVENDFMGGPFINYTLLDTLYGRVINIDLYVYAPSGEKRDLLRTLDHLMTESGVFAHYE